MFIFFALYIACTFVVFDFISSEWKIFGVHWWDWIGYSRKWVDFIEFWDSVWARKLLDQENDSFAKTKMYSKFNHSKLQKMNFCVLKQELSIRLSIWSMKAQTPTSNGWRRIYASLFKYLQYFMSYRWLYFPFSSTFHRDIRMSHFNKVFMLRK